MTNLTWLTLHGDSASLPEVTSRVVCTWPAGFIFKNVTELHISALGFLSCGHNDSAAVSVISVRQSDISNCIFQDSINNKQDGGALCYNSFTVKKIHSNITATGGALYIDTSHLTLKGSYFQNNSAVCGGALGVWKSILIITGNTFHDNSANNIIAIDNYIIDEGVGGVLSTFYSNLTLIGNTFQNNSANYYSGIAGALFVWLSYITLTGNLFQRNSAYQGGTLIALNSTLNLTGNTFQSNCAFGFGGALDLENSIGNLTNNTFQTHSSLLGGALSISNSSLSLTGNTFLHNSASQGGALIAFLNSSLNFTSNHFTDSSAQLLGGAILVAGNSIARMYGKNIIQNNTAQYGGGIATLDSQLEFTGNTIFTGNTASYGGGLYAHSTKISGRATISSNLATEEGGGVYAAKSIFHFKGNITILNNSAMNGNGGGLLLSGESKFYLQPDTHVYFLSNSAKSAGGGIKIDERNPLSYCIYQHAVTFDVGSSDCFFQLLNQTEQWKDKTKLEIETIIEELNIGIYFHNNSAVEAGGDLHGGSIDNCKLSNIETTHGRYYTGLSGSVFDNIVDNESKPDISSDPLYICSCRDNLTDCSGSYFSEPVYPGGTLEVPIMARGQRNGTTAAVVQVVNAPSIFQGSENVQNISNYCTTLRYTIHSISSQEIALYAEGPCPPTRMNVLKVVISILQCPPGFHLSHFQPICICAERLQQFTNTCLIDHQTVLRVHDAGFWVGYDNATEGLILHPHCPFDYCTSEKVYLTVDDSDKQCNYGRSGLLCGRCSENLSLALGSSRCLQCSNSYLALLPAFLFAGIVLVFLLLVLRLTVAAGTINGLIFYSNIVEVNSAIFFQPKATNILTVFIAWLNLDLGIETCFYNGLNAYIKTWLQFAFPLYVWALMGLIIIGSHFSGRIAKMFGSNPVAVLATLFLLSYAKLLRTAFAALSYTILEYPNQEQIVWLYDGNIEYLSGKHTPLLIAAIFCLIFLFLPYTMLLIFSQWLQASKSKYKVFSWVNSPNFKPFLDAYHAPYANKHRYWIGAMLLLRFILLLISAFPFNALRDPSINLLASASATTALLTLFAILGNRVYKNWYLSLLEISFLLNFTVLAVATLYVHLSTGGGNQNAVTFTSVGIAFVTFLGIVIYHFVQQMKGTWLYKRVYLRFDYIPVSDTNQCGFSVPEDPPDVVYVSGSAPTQTVVDVHISELREPCMATN